MKLHLTFFVLLAAMLIHEFAVAQIEQVSSEDILQAALKLEKAAESSDAFNDDAVRYCQCSKAKTAVHDLQKVISDNLAQPKSPIHKSILASSIWRVADVADVMEFGVGLDLTSCTHYFNSDYRAQKTAMLGLGAYSDLSAAKVGLQKLALQQTMWQEQQQRIQEQ